MLIKLSCLLMAALAPIVGASAMHPVADSTTAAPASGAEMRSALVFDDLLFRPAAPQGARGSRNVALGFGMSAVVPGAGQFYNEQPIKAVVALAIEGALVAGYFVWRARGRDAEEAYQAYAHEHWDPSRYASWLNDYVDFLEQEHGATIDAGAISAPAGIDFSSPGTWTTQEQQAVRTFFNDVRDVEDAVFHPETGASFSHKLPYFAEQQYYELIGKYFQFAPGWVDYPAWKQDGAFTGAIDPERTGPDGSKPNVQGRFLDYAGEHADANTLLRRASRISALVVLNHVVAAIDAAITAKLYNNRLDAGLDLSYDAMNEPQLLASLSWRF